MFGKGWQQVLNWFSVQLRLLMNERQPVLNMPEKTNFGVAKHELP